MWSIFNCSKSRSETPDGGTEEQNCIKKILKKCVGKKRNNILVIFFSNQNFVFQGGDLLFYARDGYLLFSWKFFSHGLVHYNRKKNNFVLCVCFFFQDLVEQSELLDKIQELSMLDDIRSNEKKKKEKKIILLEKTLKKNNNYE